MDGNLTRENGDTDGDNDHTQDRRGLQPADKADFDQGPDDHGNHHSQEDGNGQGHKVQEGNGNHPAKHDKLTLGKIDDPGGIVDNIEPDGDNGINTAISNTGHEVLNREFEGHRKIVSPKGINQFSVFTVQSYNG